MVFENILALLPKSREDQPSFKRVVIKDVNPVSGVRKNRAVFMPNRAMKTLQTRFRDYLTRSLNRGERQRVLEYAAACLPGASPVRNVLSHAKNRFFYLLDVKDAFPSVDGRRLAQVLVSLDPALTGKTDEVLAFLRQYFLDPEGGGLFVGGPASNDLFNLYAGALIDQALGEWSELRNITYTRYVDDFTFSSKSLITKEMRREIRSLIEKSGFAINHAKSQFLDLHKGPIAINGVGVKPDGTLFLPRGYLRKIRGLIHRARTRMDINPALVHGMMGVFFAMTPRWGRRRNRIEERLAAEYEDFRRAVSKAGWS